MTELHELVKNAAANMPAASAHEIAVSIRPSVSEDDIIKLIAAEVSRSWRNTVRGVERNAFLDLPKGVLKSPPKTTNARIKVNDLSSLRPLLSSKFAVGNGEHVTWEQATLEQHRFRISFLSKKRDGINETIERHSEAINILEDSGAGCLGDLVLADAA